MKSQNIAELPIDTERFSDSVIEQIKEVRRRAEIFADKGQELHGLYAETDSSYALMNENDRLSFKIQLYRDLIEEQKKVKQDESVAFRHYEIAFELERKLLVAESDKQMNLLYSNLLD